jgi:metal-dependent amidase/aminoacylase/carboxypeptidase family protein
VIADKAEIKGTVRSFNPDVRKKLEERIRTVSAGACQNVCSDRVVTFRCVMVAGVATSFAVIVDVDYHKVTFPASSFHS